MAARRGLGALIVVLVSLVVGFLVALGIAQLIRDAGRAPTVWVLPLPSGVVPLDRDAVDWFARILVVPAVAWLLIGTLAARTRLIRRPGAAAARATWLSSTRPWRARESTLGMLRLDRWLILLVPAALLVATLLLEGALGSLARAAVLLFAWAVFALILRAFIGARSPWPATAAAGGVAMFGCTLTLLGLAIPGEELMHVGSALWMFHTTVAVAATLWAIVAAGWAMSRQVGGHRATGAVIAAVGGAAIIPAVAAAVADIPQGRADLSAWWIVTAAIALSAVGVIVAASARDR